MEVALFTRAWIEMHKYRCSSFSLSSPSSRGRGLKYCKIIGAYIFWVSPSSRGRGLKSCGTNGVNNDKNVALFTRAWIEIISRFPVTVQKFVALFTRAWIEIFAHPPCTFLSSPSSRGRGLKCKPSARTNYKS